VTANYDAYGLNFVYPENWNLIEACDEWPKEITLETPSGAFLSLHIYPEESLPAKVVEEALQSIREEYDDRGMESVPFDGNLVLDGPSAVGYNVSFSLLDFIVQSQLRCFVHGDSPILAISQAEDREFEELHEVFLAILWSLVKGISSESRISN